MKLRKWKFWRWKWKKDSSFQFLPQKNNSRKKNVIINKKNK